MPPTDARAPLLRGRALSLAARLVRAPGGSRAAYAMFRKELALEALERFPESARGEIPLDAKARAGRAPRRLPATLPWPTVAPDEGADALARAYRAGEDDPERALARAVELARALDRSTDRCGPVHVLLEARARDAARASAQRLRDGRPLGPLDGVPFAIKEQIDVRGVVTRAGATFPGGEPAPRDATCVERLVAQGAVPVGLTPMTELGMTPTGASPKRRLPPNPHDPAHLAGGSSTGSGVAVATGVVPFALAADGGGSIRIPSALVGAFGLKPTWGRVSRSGDASGGTVAHLGPIGATTLDLARVLDAVAGPDGADPETFAAPMGPEGGFARALGGDVRGLVVGVPEREWAEASDEVARAGREALRALERRGVRLVDVASPWFELAPAIGYLTIAGEALSKVRVPWRAHRGEFGHDLALAFSAYEHLSAADMLDAARLRSGLRAELATRFRELDLLALPTTTTTAPACSPAARLSGFSDARLIGGLCRFNFLANLTGLPAASIPVGTGARGLPIGLQLVGDAWDEGTILAASAELERQGVARAVRARGPRLLRA